MATTTHTIRSYYDPADRETLERETGQQTDDQSNPWQTESSFSAQRRTRAAPTFVPATISNDDWRISLHSSSPTATPEKSDHSSTSAAEWYRSLTTASSLRESLPLRPPSAPSPRCRDSTRPPPTPHITKNDWFITKALRSEPPTKPSSPAPSLADLLARDPPPLPSEGRYIPPVWLHIGPSNRGFGMLQRSGWNEGEGLGAHAVRRVARARDVDEPAASSVTVVQDVTSVQNTPEVIGLTLSDSKVSEDASQNDVMQNLVQASSEEPHMQRSLLTPLPTVLKADRLGIGLKAKTEGPYRQSKKRVTHGTAALAAHIRSGEEMRRSKALLGKGKRGFAKVYKREEDRRKAMLAYLNK